ncbi:hypothetical protein RHS04_01414 [Rhizoctonia solani]|uniref:Uncharacterized protein n=1 Tax=Rhizoctonia solani TaxID=456999 RepID=A0A8H7LM73_9AGAM|nr:hypothetical protein RHS04_01414 [Rhizoctonia solani]
MHDVACMESGCATVTAALQHSTGPRKSRERSGTRYCQRALRSVWYDALKGSWSALKSSPSNPDSSDPNEEVPKTGALQSAPGFLGAP